LFTQPISQVPKAIIVYRPNPNRQLPVSLQPDKKIPVPDIKVTHQTDNAGSALNPQFPEPTGIEGFSILL
jgi:hypothetical protein